MYSASASCIKWFHPIRQNSRAKSTLKYSVLLSLYLSLLLKTWNPLSLLARQLSVGRCHCSGYYIASAPHHGQFGDTWQDVRPRGSIVSPGHCSCYLALLCQTPLEECQDRDGWLYDSIGAGLSRPFLPLVTGSQTLRTRR